MMVNGAGVTFARYEIDMSQVTQDTADPTALLAQLAGAVS